MNIIVPSQIHEEPNPNDLQNINVIKENNETPSYPKLEARKNNNDNKGFAENLDFQYENDNKDIVLQNKQNFNNNSNQGVEVQKKEENPPNNNNDARDIPIEENLDTLDETVCETIVIIMK